MDPEIRGRQITDSILIANEFVDERKKKRQTGVVCKLDMENAYDRVDCEFLIWVMRRKGFEERWVRWIEGCIGNPYFSVLLNGTSKRFSCPQGD